MDRKQTESKNRELETLYGQLAQSAARLMVVHEASTMLRSTHDPEQLASGLLDIIAEAVFAGTGCVTSLANDELKILATRGLQDHEVDEIAGDEGEARVWFAVSDADSIMSRQELVTELDLETGDDDGDGDGEPADEEPWDPEADSEDDDDAVSWDDEDTPAPSGAPHFELYVPLRVEDDVLGVLALGRRVDGRPVAIEDRQLAESLSAHLALALDHANLFEERSRRIEQLGVLLQISREITSTLDLDRVLATICQMLNLVLPNRRTTVALGSGGSLTVRASTDPEFRTKNWKQDPLHPVLAWGLGARMSVNTHRQEIEGDEDADGRAHILPLLDAEEGPRGLALLPLTDDQGTLGLLAIETGEDKAPLDDDTDELIGVLANQTTVAIRNAELYQQIPMVSMLEPIVSRARRATSNRRRFVVRGSIVALLLVLGFTVPFPAWVAGDAQLRPLTPISLRSGTAGTVGEILVREGQRVEAGARIAQLQQDEFLVALEQVGSELQQMRAEALRARAQGDLATYRARQARMTELTETERYLQEELARTTLVAPTTGTVLTPDVHLKQGEHLSRGELLLELADLSVMELEVSVPGDRIHRIAPGQRARIKVHAYPDRTFHGEVDRIAPEAEPDGRFRVAVRLENPNGALRPGMTGRAHVETPRQPVLQTLLGPILDGLRLKFWV